MPQFWIALFFILLAVAELYESVKSISLPFPAYLALGTLLAVASNHQSRAAFGQIRQPPLSEVKIADPVLSSSQQPMLPTAESQPASVKPPAIVDRANGSDANGMSASERT
jgi:hypothetical protein